MKQRILQVGLMVGLIFFVCSCSGPQADNGDAKTAESWEVGILAYTFRNFSFFEAVDKASELGIGNIGGYPGQAIGGGLDDKMSYTMDDSLRKQIREHLASKNVVLADFGVVSPATEEEWVALFEFAAAMDIACIVSEPDPSQLDFVGNLCDTYQINVAIHNHAAPSRYWNPDSVMRHLDGRTDRLGVCADVGHWVRSGLDPVASLKTVQGRLMELHFKDVSEPTTKGVDVVWGTGANNVAEMLEELKRQSFSGVLSIEYESNPEDNMQAIRESLDFYGGVIQR